VLTGAWGSRSGELLERASASCGASLHRVGSLTMLEPPQIAAGSWCCWLFGEPEDHGVLAERFGLRSGNDLLVAFARALGELGEAACALLCGRFAVVLLDRDRDRCLLVRDQLGAQPLLHVRVNGGLLFAEHERQLIELLPRTPSPDRLALLCWVESGLMLPGRSLYEGIERLPAGHRLLLGEGATRTVERWWHLRYQGVAEGPPAELAEHLRDAAFSATARALACARRPAVKLSGGLDSACVAAGLAANGFADGRALAIGGTFTGHSLADESELIEATASQARLPLELVAFDPASSMLAPAVAHIARWRLPPATPTLFLWQPLFARARELGVDCMLDGEGGDEVFGLASYLIADMLRAGRLATAWSLTGRVPGIGVDPDFHIRFRVLRHFGLSPLQPKIVRHWRRRPGGAASPDPIVGQADARALAELQLLYGADRQGPVWWRMQAESVIDMRDLVDMGAHFRRETVDANLELRHPFLYDLHLVEAALRLPPQAQFDPVRDRPLLRDALNGLIPESVRTRHQKSHFTSLVLAGIQASEPELIEPLRRPDAPVRAYVDRRGLESKLEATAEARPILTAGSLWRVAIANTWLASEHFEGS
jgi:asparagine synthase (glutamine-hydrolysing)